MVESLTHYHKGVIETAKVSEENVAIAQRLTKVISEGMMEINEIVKERLRKLLYSLSLHKYPN
jgi:hypothetical protein